MIDVEAAVAKLSYKPGWKFTLEREPIPYLCDFTLVITATVPHSTTLQPVEFAIKRIIPTMVTHNEVAFLLWVKSTLGEAEIHEMREFFRYDGQLVDDPHATVPAA